jgi:HK97 family phage major capsid protein
MTTVHDLAVREALQHLTQAGQKLRVAETYREASDERSRLLRAVAEGYSPMRALRALHEDAGLARAAVIEHQVSAMLEPVAGRAPAPGAIFCPNPLRRDLTVAVAGAGGYLVTSELRIFDEAYREASLAERLGVRRVPGVENQIAARVSAKTTPYWLGSEGTAITEGQPTFAQIASSPKHCGAVSEVSRQLFKQTAATAQALVFGELGAAVSEAADAAMLTGSGAGGQPTGVLNVGGVQTQAGASFALATATAALNKLETAKALRNSAALAWVLAPDAAKLLREREKSTGSGQYLLDDQGRLCGTRAFVTANLPAGTAILADWSGLIAVDYSVLELATNPFGADAAAFRANLAQVRALQSVDFSVLRAQAFVVVTSIS